MPEIVDPAAKSGVKLRGNTLSNTLKQTAKAITETLNACCTRQFWVTLLLRLQLCVKSVKAAELGRDHTSAQFLSVPLTIGYELGELLEAERTSACASSVHGVPDNSPTTSSMLEFSVFRSSDNDSSSGWLVTSLSRDSMPCPFADSAEGDTA
eukprot:CAMPEP_0172907812 /NCGR_PEP_ID=MMETSP1075-20121228/179575_1 /TAXON_ID=2916 /ORGANISM="Ceratium fusus, Strain PA161109" /LENGTH=152 /DNA_ID=CAMNT_0013765491 /DNA_START=133 /DNA_END=588 /DNA_ORIENTATION=-